MIEERVILRRTKRERQKERLKSKFNRYSLNLFSKGTIFDITISTDHMILSRQISNIKNFCRTHPSCVYYVVWYDVWVLRDVHAQNETTPPHVDEQ